VFLPSSDRCMLNVWCMAQKKFSYGCCILVKSGDVCFRAKSGNKMQIDMLPECLCFML
jgi:hypothetical protein